MGKETRDINAGLCWIAEKNKFKKEVNMCFFDYSKAFGSNNHIMGIPEHFTVKLRTLYTDQ